MSYLYDAMKENYAKITLLGKPVLFSCARIDRSTVPAELYVYELRHADEGFEPCQIGKRIFVNFIGTILSKEPFDLVPSETTSNAYRGFDYKEDWEYEPSCWTIQSYLESFEKEEDSYEKQIA